MLFRSPSAYTDAPGDKEARQKGMPQSKHTEKYHALYDERINNSINVDKNMNEEAEKGLAKKAKESGISLETLRKVYNRGMAAWRGGHRPGTTPQQWGMARVNSYITKGKGTYYGADSDLSGQSKKKQKNENISTDYVGTGMNVPYYGAYDKVEVHNESKDIDKMFEAFLEENVHALDTNMESHLFGTDAARIAAQQMTPGEPGYVGMGKEASNFTYSREGEEAVKKEKKNKEEIKIKEIENIQTQLDNDMIRESQYINNNHPTQITNQCKSHAEYVDIYNSLDNYKTHNFNQYEENSYPDYMAYNE